MMRLEIVLLSGWSVRVCLSVGAAWLIAAFAETLVQVQDGAFMWCQATAGIGLETTAYYSAFFTAGAHQAEAKARAFKSEGEEAEIRAAAVVAKCTAPADYDTAVAARNTAMREEPYEVLNWEG